MPGKYADNHNKLGKKAVILLSGGLDSTTVLAIAKSRGYGLYALTVSYGQRHAAEIVWAERVAGVMGVEEHALIDLDLRRFGGSALTDDMGVPRGRSPEDMASGIPVTYVPARNTILLSLALAWAETLGSADIFIGVNALDYSGYPDCRPEFIEAFRALAAVATRFTVGGGEIKIHAPLIALTKAEIIKWGTALGVDYSMTSSCYTPDTRGMACGECDSCLLRKKGFEEAGLPDPTRYSPARAGEE